MQDTTFADRVLKTERELEALPGIKSAFIIRHPIYCGSMYQGRLSDLMNLYLPSEAGHRQNIYGDAQIDAMRKANEGGDFWESVIPGVMQAVGNVAGAYYGGPAGGAAGGGVMSWISDLLFPNRPQGYA